MTLRLSTMRRMDDLVILDRGRIVERCRRRLDYFRGLGTLSANWLICAA